MAVTIGDVKSSGGLTKLNSYLEDKSYAEGYLPTQTDVLLFNAVSKLPDAKFVHAKRWYNHIHSFGAEKNKFPKGTKTLNDLGVTSAPAKDDDDDFELFGSDEEVDLEAEKAREERLKAYNEKKAKKPQVIAKSNVILDVKPWDDETDMKVMEEKVRTIQCDGLVWGISKLVPLAYGIKKLQIVCVVEDEKVSIDWLTEEIEKFEDYVQSVDIAAFQKI